MSNCESKSSKTEHASKDEGGPDIPATIIREDGILKILSAVFREVRNTLVLDLHTPNPFFLDLTHALGDIIAHGLNHHGKTSRSNSRVRSQHMKKEGKPAVATLRYVEG